MSFIRLKGRSSGQEINVNTDQIIYFDPILDDGNHVGSIIVLSKGVLLEVEQTNRTLRGLIKKGDEE